jgi:PAS domain S-box-containing protein
MKTIKTDKVSIHTLLESEQRFKGFSEATYEAIFFCENEECIDQNLMAEKMFGYTLSEIFGKSGPQWVVPDEREIVRSKILSAYQDPYEATALRKDGSTFSAEIRGRILHYKGRDIVVTTVSDISKQKQAELALRESENRFRYLADASMEAIFFTKKGICLDANQVAIKMFGFKKRSEVIGMFVTDIIADESQEVAKYNNLNNILEPYESIGKRLDGTKFPISIRAKSMPYKDEGIVRVTSVKDITDRKQAEEALRESEEKYRNLFTSANDAIFLMQDDKFITCNPKTLEMFACKEDEIIGFSPTEFSPKFQPNGNLSSENVLKRINAALAGEPQCFEWVHQQKDGTPFNAEVSLNKMTLSDGEYIHAIVRNITERKRAEIALKHNEARLSTLISNLPGMAYLCKNDEHWTILYVNDACQQLTGYRSEQLINNKELSYNELIHPDDRSYVNEHIRKTFNTKEHFEIEYRIISATGEEKWVWERGIHTQSKDHEAYLIEGVIHDITERKKAEARLSESEKRYRLLFENAPIGIVSVNRKGQVIEINPSLLQILGSPSMEASKSIQILSFPPLVKAGISSAINRCFESGQLISAETNYVSKWSKSIHVHYRVTPNFIQNGQVTSVQLLIEDITDRKLAEKSLKESEKQLRQLTKYMDEKNEDEKKRIAEEIHDGLGQLLTGLKMELQWIAKKWPKESSVVENKFIAMNNILDTAVKEVQKLSFELRPKMLDDLGLLETLKSETRQFEEKTGIYCHFQFYPDEFDIEYNRSSTIYRVLMELLTNIYRHAKATKVDIKLEMRNNKCIFTVIDNGIGITQKQIDGKSSFGLISIHERVNVWDGKVSITGKHKKGTTVSVTIPL